MYGDEDMGHARTAPSQEGISSSQASSTELLACGTSYA